MSIRYSIVLLAALAGSALAQNPPEGTVTTEGVTPGVYVLYGSGGNIGVSAGRDGVFLIDDLRGIHVAQAHTDGDVFVHFRNSNVIHTGDLMFAGMYPFIDLDSGGSVTGLIAAVNAMLAIADDRTRIIPGHGKVTDRAGLTAYREMLAVTSARVRDLVKTGKSIDEILAAKPNADYDATLSLR